MARDIRTPALVTLQPILRDPRDPIVERRIEPQIPAYLLSGGSSVVMARQDQRQQRAAILELLAQDDATAANFAKRLREWHADDPAILHALTPTVRCRADLILRVQK